MKSAIPVFAVIRFDRFLSDLQPVQRSFTVKEIVFSQREAESEVERLNRLNKEKDCEYFFQPARLRAKPA